MTIVYMAKRQIYPDQTELFGPYDSREAALACAQDSLYPYQGTVIEIDLAKLQSSYLPVSSYAAWEQDSAETYYLLGDGAFEIPEYWKPSVSVEVIRRDDFPEYKVRESITQQSEQMLIAMMAFLIYEDCEKVFVLRDQTPGALEFLKLSDQPEFLFKVKGVRDRAKLVRYALETIEAFQWAWNAGESAREAFCDNVVGFWSEFVDEDGELPDGWDRELYN